MTPRVPLMARAAGGIETDEETALEIRPAPWSQTVSRACPCEARSGWTSRTAGCGDAPRRSARARRTSATNPRRPRCSGAPHCPAWAMSLAADTLHVAPSIRRS